MSPSIETAAAPRRRQRSPAQLAMIRRTVARALTEPEFDVFLEVADSVELDPLRRQIVPLVIAPEDAERRSVIPWTTIDGLRVIAARAGDYRPMEDAPVLDVDPARADPATNPLGLVRAEVRVWKRSGEVWHPVAGEAWWDEYAPVHQRRVGDERGAAAVSVIELDPSWRRMARLMLSKCAEALALRRGWPDLLSGLYAEDELHRLQRDAETARLGQGDGRTRNVRGECRAPAYLLAVNIGGPLESVAAAELPDRLTALYRDARSVDEIDALEAINRTTLQAFWSCAPAEAVAVKRVAETRRAALSAEVACAADAVAAVAAVAATPASRPRRGDDKAPGGKLGARNRAAGARSARKRGSGQ